MTGGSISIDGRDVTDLAPRHRDVAMVFQSYALYPHMTVRQNLGYGLKVRRTSKDETRRRVDEVAAMLGLDELLERRPVQLSGGQRQRVAMGRAIVRQPKAFLMDEPLEPGCEAARGHARLARPAPSASRDDDCTRHARPGGGHDAGPESRGDAGRPNQVDAPQRLYEQPRDIFVAGFIGSPAMNLVEATIAGDEVSFGQFAPSIRNGALRRARRVVLGIRPESFEDVHFASHDLPTLDVEVRVLEELDPTPRLLPSTRPRWHEVLEAEGEEDAQLIASDGALLNARIDSRTRARVGASLGLVVDPARFHFFDVETGASLLDPDRSMVLTS